MTYDATPAVLKSSGPRSGDASGVEGGPSKTLDVETIGYVIGCGRARRKGIPMTRLIRRTAFMAALAIAAPAWAQSVFSSENVVSPGPVSRPPPEAMPGGTVVLRGSLPATDVSPSAFEKSRKESTNYQPAVLLPPGIGWNHRYDTAGVDQRTDRNYDTTGFDQRFDMNGLTH